MPILMYFGLGGLADKLPVIGVHSLGNLVSLGCDGLILFDRLRPWFEGTDEVRC